MRQVSTWNENVVYYLVTDHLGTTSVVLCGNASGCDGVPNGGRVAESRHYPYGGERWTWPEGESTFPTDYRFTGQRDVGLGLTHMGARFLDTYLGRWLSADTIVPEPGNPQSLNRYSWVLGNPLRYVDPTGHKEDGECGPNDNCQEPPEWWIQLLSDPEFRAWLATLSEDLIWELVPSAFGVYGEYGFAFGACLEGGMSAQFALQLNWRSGELTFLYGPTADVYLGTPRVVSLSGGGGGAVTWGASRNATLKGFSAYAGATGQVDAVAELGVKVIQSNALTTADTNANGKEEIVLYVDPVSGKHVRSLQVGLSGGVNAAPNGVELGAVGGANLTWGFNLASGWKVNRLGLFAELLAALLPVLPND